MKQSVRLGRVGGITVRAHWSVAVIVVIIAQVLAASNEDDAHELADQVRREASADATVRAGRSAVYLPFAGF